MYLVMFNRAKKEVGKIMPEDFEKCRRRGGRIRTKSLSGGRYIHLCFIDGKSYAGEIKQRKGERLKEAVK